MAISQRNDATRRLSNFYLKITGEACLLLGWDIVRKQVLDWIEQWGGSLTDEWVRRLDLCLDLPGYDLDQVIFPACAAKQVLSTMKQSNSSSFDFETTGFTIGSRENVRLTMYHKVPEVHKQKSEIYRLAMKERRWNGEIPEVAARIEYQMYRSFFQTFGGLKTATDVIERLPEILAHLTRTEERPVFMLTDVVPDRKSRHQNRVGIHPHWAEIIRQFREQIGQSEGALKRLDRDLIDAKRACANTIGYLTSAAAQLGMLCESKEDLVTVLRELFVRNDIQDEVVRMKWEDKARRYGTFVGVTEFAFGNNLAA